MSTMTRTLTRSEPTVESTTEERSEKKTKGCKVDGCLATGRLKRGWCNKHYIRWQSHGDPLVGRNFTSVEDRFWAKVNKTDTCWLWMGSRIGGYGQFANEKERMAHRWSYENLVGPIPAGFWVDHLCRVTNCVNPDHLEAVSPGENTYRGSLARRGGASLSRPSHPYTPKPRVANLDKTCSIDGCEFQPKRKGMCLRHYWSSWKHGDPLYVDNLPTREEKIWARVNKNGPVPDFSPELGPCWIWTGNIEEQGYGVYPSGSGSTVKAYRLIYEMIEGEIPKGLQPDHLCRVRACVNPDHLEPVTKKENVLRGFGPTAINARKTHCIHGHEFSKENTLVLPNGNRQCRMCSRERNRLYHIRKKAAACA